MKTKNEIRSFSTMLDRKYGERGTAGRAKFEEDAYSYYSGILLKDARRRMKMTQTELASKVGTDAAYISRIERNEVIPSVGFFFKIANALGFSVELVHSV